MKTTNYQHQAEDPEDSFPLLSDAGSDPILKPQDTYLPAREGSAGEREVSSMDVLFHLGLGAALLGIDAVSKLLQEKQSRLEIATGEQQPLLHLDDEQDQLRYAMIGLILNTPRAVRRRTSRATQAANKGINIVSDMLRPVTGSRVFRPINSRFDQMVARGERIVGGWIDSGRRGERASQALLQETTDEVVGELVDMLASRPEITDLVQQQSMGMVDELTEELQGRASAADTLLERIVYLLLPGSKKDTTPTLVIPFREEEQPVRDKKQTPKGRS